LICLSRKNAPLPPTLSGEGYPRFSLPNCGENNRFCGFSLTGSRKNGGLLLANLLQGSRSTFSCVSFPSFVAFKEGMWDTQISALLSSPTVSGGLMRQIASLQKGSVEKTTLTNPALCDHIAFTTGVSTTKKSNT
jgi:hypothetical protein